MSETPSSSWGDPPRGTRRFAYDPNDDQRTARQKQAIFVVAGGCSAAGIVWTAMYYAVFGWTLTTLMPAVFTVVVGSALAISHRTKNHFPAVYAQIFCIIYVTAFIQWSIGELFASGFVLVWAFCGPITALGFFSFRKSSIFFGLYLVNVAITLLFDDRFAQHGLEVSEPVRYLFFGMNLCVSSFVVFSFASYFADTADTQRSRAERLQTSLAEEKAKQLGAYTLEEKIGAGGMGVVYKARHALLRRPTAVKLLPVERIGAHSLARFEREVQHTAALTHPNTVAIYDYGRSSDGTFYYAMEYLDGIDLDGLVRRDGALPAARVLYLLVQVCDALAEAHEAGLVHRDVKPANIMICRMGQRADVVKVLDFGLVKELDTDVQMTQDDAVAGTPAYIAPEAVSAPSTVGPAADLYALGAVAYWLLTGRPVFVANTMVAVFAAHLHMEPEAPSKHVEGIPEAVDRLVLQCLAKEPGERPASARELLRMLEEVAEREALRWPATERHAWWDAFERTRTTDVPRPISRSSATLTVGPRARSHRPKDVSGVDVVGETVLQGRARGE